MAAKKVVHIQWVDAVGQLGWMKTEHVAPIPLCNTVGYLIGENKDMLTVSATTCDVLDNFSGCITIPKKMIKKRRMVKL